ncbi:hypothetical protein CBM2599_A150178 [Cupriavidus taiwanensis]|uniref:Uncharacterized protein n=1 Tax=Cupriavidus taiwanensis TaxID=164546 RepID=A0A375CWY8_9BURK|nr:hypothetical protein CBM2599_A150178 [Cupriavidus taiwanensis]SOY84704.1 hypothetical protein CBM2600_A140176 [Cupriavidus taiwanensis]SPD65640.1 protein of unknown function [Cupriavidus taiwanensis]
MLPWGSPERLRVPWQAPDSYRNQ